MRSLSKSKLMAFRQCPKRLWLEIHEPDLRSDSAEAVARFDTGNLVGDLAKALYDPKNKGEELEPQETGYDAAFAKTKSLLESSNPIFEACFSAGGALALADVMLPVRQGGRRAWRMVEVKSSTSVKNYHRDDVAIQAFVAKSSGVLLSSISLAHIDSDWVYPGKEDYEGLLKEEDLTQESLERGDEVKQWISEAQKIVAKRKEPKRATGKHCTDPFGCGFLEYCQSQESRAEYPVHWLPRIQSTALKNHIDAADVIDMRDVPDAMLNEIQRRVKKHTLSGRKFFDAANAALNLAAYKLPAYFLDFETIQFAVPIWKGIRPYQQTPFQFSLHRLGRTGKLDSKSFLDLSGNDPSLGFAEALISSCGERGSVFVYNEGFEKARISELADRFPRLKAPLMAIHDRVVDLLPIVRNHYYHPKQQGSWSIKKVLPTIAPDLRYESLDGVQNGGMAMNAFLEAIAPDTPPSRKSQIESQLQKYCEMDTYAMVRLWSFLSCRSDLQI